MKLSRTNGRGLDLFQQLIRDQFGKDRVAPDQRIVIHSTGAGVLRDVRRSRHLPDADKPGDSGGEATPVPIPNTEVKLSSAEDTERAAFRENRSSPGFLRVGRNSFAAAFGPGGPLERRPGGSNACSARSVTSRDFRASLGEMRPRAA